MSATIGQLLQKLVEIRAFKGVDKLKAQGALRTLEPLIGHLDASFLTEELEFGQRVYIPGDDAPWLVFASYGDGTVDLIRDQATGFLKDRMIGYRLGDTQEQYEEELKKED